jgi:hypothetical protein
MQSHPVTAMTVDAELSNAAKGRLAGLSYLALIATGIFGLAYVPGQLVSMSDPAGTFAKIQASDFLYRAGLAAEIACYVIYPVLLVFLHRLFAPYGRSLAMLMVLFAAISIPISFGAIAHKDAVIDVINGVGAFDAMDAGAREAALIDNLRAYKSNIAMAEIFWGLWLLPYGLLVLKTGLIPRFFGVFLVLGCFGYLANYFGPLFFESYKGSMFAEVVSIPDAIGEIGSAFWLAIFGAREVSAK